MALVLFPNRRKTLGYCGLVAPVISPFRDDDDMGPALYSLMGSPVLRTGNRLMEFCGPLLVIGKTGARGMYPTEYVVIYSDGINISLT